MCMHVPACMMHDACVFGTKRLQVFGHLEVLGLGRVSPKLLWEKWVPRATAQNHVVRADLNKVMEEGGQDGRGRGGKPGEGAPG